MNDQVNKTASRNIVKKITVAAVCGGRPDIAKLIEYMKTNGEAAVLPLMGIVGIASDFTPGRTILPDGKEQTWLKLLGQFKATSVDTGEVFVSGACILPGAGNDLVYGALKGAQEGGGGGGTVSFAFRIGIKRDVKGITGYAYVVEQIYQPEVADPISLLEAKLSTVIDQRSEEKVAQIAAKRK